MNYYTGIGSRETPRDVLNLMNEYAAWLAQRTWVLRSGAAPGADTAFEMGAVEAGGIGDIYLPWSGFEQRANHPNYGRVRFIEGPHPDAFPIAAQFHPAWDRCKQGARRLHARNVHQVLGENVSAPALSKFVLCWTPGASGSGGTGQAIRIATHYGIPTYDLADPQVRARIEASLQA